MKKIVLNLAVTLDGFIEGQNGEYDWCFADQDYGMKDLFSRIDTILLGRKSYELLIKTEAAPYPEMVKYVASRTLNSVISEAKLIGDDLENEVEGIKKQKGKDIWLFGGADLTNSLLKAGLVDEMQLSIHPLLLGSGKPLFKRLDQRVGLNLIETKNYSTGLVQVHYRFDKTNNMAA